MTYDHFRNINRDQIGTWNLAAVVLKKVNGRYAQQSILIEAFFNKINKFPSESSI